MGTLQKALTFSELVAFVFRHQEWNQICGPALLNKLCDLQSFSNEGGSALMLRFLCQIFRQR